MPPDFEAFYLRHCRAIYRVCFAFLKNASPVQGELLAVRLTEGLTEQTMPSFISPIGVAESFARAKPARLPGGGLLLRRQKEAKAGQGGPGFPLDKPL